MIAMAGCVKWLVVLLLAAMSSSCATSTLHQWAFEEWPRSEVLAFVDGNGVGDTLIVRVHGEETQPDGIYEINVSPKKHGSAIGDSAPRRFSDAEEQTLRRTFEDRCRVGRLISTNADWEPSWEPVDAYELAAEGLLPIDISKRKYFVSVVDESDAESNLRTKVAVHVRKSTAECAQLKGYVYLPPARREPARVVVGVFVAPIAFVFDVATSPVQFLVATSLMARAIGKIVDSSSANAISALAMILGAFPSLHLEGRHLPALIGTAPANPNLLVLAGYSAWNRMSKRQPDPNGN